MEVSLGAQRVNEEKQTIFHVFRLMLKYRHAHEIKIIDGVAFFLYVVQNMSPVNLISGFEIVHGTAIYKLLTLAQCKCAIANASEKCLQQLKIEKKQGE